MKNSKRLVIPLLFSLVLGAALMSISITATGAGHGTYIPSALFFPGPVLIAIWMRIFTPITLFLAAIQWPVYGAILALVKGAPNRSKYVKWLVVQHVLLLLLCFLFDDGQFLSVESLKNFLNSMEIRQFEQKESSPFQPGKFECARETNGGRETFHS